MGRIEWLAGWREAAGAEPLEGGEKLLPDEGHALDEGIGSAFAGGRQRAVEVIEHFQEVDEHRAPPALDVFSDLFAEARAGLIELVRGAAVLGDELLQL